MKNEVNTKKFSTKLMKKIAIFSLPVVALIAVVVALVTGKGEKSKAAYIYEMEDVLGTVGHLTIVEIVPDLSQVQFPYLVEGREPIAHILYSDDLATRQTLSPAGTDHTTDLHNYANIDWDGDKWVNNNDFLNYVYGEFEECLGDTVGSYLVDEQGNYVQPTDSNAYRKAGPAHYEVDPNGEYYKTTNQAGNEVYFKAQTRADGKLKSYNLVAQLNNQQVVYVALTPEMLNRYIEENPDYLVNGIPYYDAEGNLRTTGATMVCVFGGNYGHLEKVTAQYGKYSYVECDYVQDTTTGEYVAKAGTGTTVNVDFATSGCNPNARYAAGSNDLSWASVEALYEYAGIHQMPIYVDHGVQGIGNFEKLRLMLRYMPYSTFKEIYENIDHTNGSIDWEYTYYTETFEGEWIDGVQYPAGVLKENKQKVTELSEQTMQYYYNQVYLGRNGWDSLDSIWSEANPNGYQCREDKTGMLETYNLGSNYMGANLFDNIYFGNGEDVFLGQLFKYKLTANSNTYFHEVTEALEEIATDDRVTTASVFKYLMRIKGMASLRHEIKILEIEPSYDFKYATVTKTSEEGGVYTYTPNRDEIKDLIVLMGYRATEEGIDQVKVDVMYSGAFAGYKGDLSEYDLIYIGDRKGAINTNTSPLLYKYIGDTVFSDVQGQLYGNENITAGNDITTWGMKALQEFVDGGRVLMLGNNLYRMNKNVVDEKSQLYKNLSTLVSSKTTVNQATEGSLRNAYKISSTRPLIKFEIGGKPVEYNSDNENSQLEPNAILTLENGTPTYTYQFLFNVQAAPNTTYKAYLYLDMNGDGRFLAESVGDDESEKVNLNCTFTTNDVGATTETVATSVNLSYIKGLVPWKFEIVEVGNELNRAVEIGYTVCKPQEKETVNVLQIVPNDKGTFVLANSSDSYVTSDRGYEKDFRNKLADYTEGSGVYDINIYAITVEDFEKWYQSGSKTVDGYVYNSATGVVSKSTITSAPYDAANSATDRLSGCFDMVILGFGDKFNNTSFENSTAIQNIYDFAKKGSSVLMAHDLISRNIADEGETVSGDKWDGWNIEFGNLFRDLAGQDRFGYSQIKGHISTSDSPVYSDRNGLTGNQLYGFTTTEVLRIAKTKNQYATTQTDSPALFENYPVQGDKFWTTNTVMLNKGPVTTYPYTLDENIEVQTTHPQYFQLNLEDESVMVWYNLAGVSLGNSATDDEPGSHYYNIVPNDAYGNYYVYTKDNITYTGAGHGYGEEDGKSTPPTVDEMELFINTIVAAIRVGNHAPEVTLTNGSKNMNKGESDWIVYVGENDGTCDLNYIVNDVDLVTGTTIKNVKVYWDRNRDGSYVAPDGDNTTIDDVLIANYDSTIENRNPAVQTVPNGDVAQMKSDDPAVLTLDLADWLESYSQGANATERCIYVNIVATDAKGASGMTRVKIMPIELYDLE